MREEIYKIDIKTGLIEVNSVKPFN